ncbi:MAG: hypothetical protein BGN88_13910, partial [Clostridiales bacterium 43-6]
MGYNFAGAVRADGTVIMTGKSPDYDAIKPLAKQFKNIVELYACGTAGLVGLVGLDHPDPAMRGRVVTACTSGDMNNGKTKMNNALLAADTPNPGDPEEYFVQISATNNHIVGVTNRGRAIAGGNISNAKLGSTNGGTDIWPGAQIVQVGASNENTFGLKADGTIVYKGSSVNFATATTWTGIKRIIADGNTIIGFQEDGTILTQGDNTSGELSFPWAHDEIEDFYIDTNVTDVTIAKLSNGLWKFWGKDSFINQNVVDQACNSL